MIEVRNLSFSYTGRELYDNVCFDIPDGSHCALIGSNGTGKTTLMDMLVHPDDYLYTGKITLAENCRFGYVPQFLPREKDIALTVTEFLSRDFEEMQANTASVCARLETITDPDEMTAALEEYQTCMDEYDAADGDNYTVNIPKRLKTAGLSHTADLPLSAVSGGEYKLIQIIRAMLRRPTVLIMDEPDVFLDFENLDGLQGLINNYEGTLLSVTHNRYLLHNCFDRILHLENCDIQEFDGTYTEYNFALLQAKVEAQAKLAKYDEFVAFQETVVERFRDNATEVIDPARGRALHSRVSYLERLKKNRIKDPFVDLRCPEIRFPELSSEETEEGTQQERTVLRAENYALAFDRPLLENVSFEVKAGEKVAVIGANGTGKTSMLREIMAGENPALQLGEGVRPAFLAQLQELGSGDKRTVFELLNSLDIWVREEAAVFLAPYCFESDVLDSRVEELSGGERTLLGLACLQRSEANFLLLDEPTSHLDTGAQIALEKAVKAWPGTVMMVSHDFYTAANCSDYVLFAEEGTIRRMSGRAFRKMVYRRHFRRDYLELEQRKQELETKIGSCLYRNDYRTAQTLCAELGEVITRLEE